MLNLRNLNELFVISLWRLTSRSFHCKIFRRLSSMGFIFFNELNNVNIQTTSEAVNGFMNLKCPLKVFFKTSIFVKYSELFLSKSNQTFIFYRNKCQKYFIIDKILLTRLIIDPNFIFLSKWNKFLFYLSRGKFS